MLLPDEVGRSFGSLRRGGEERRRASGVLGELEESRGRWRRRVGEGEVTLFNL